MLSNMQHPWWPAPRLIPARDKGMVFFLHFILYEKSLSPLEDLSSF